MRDDREMSPSQVTCLKCGRVSFALSRAVAQAHVDDFNQYYESLDADRRRRYGGPTSIDSYKCGCGGTAFRAARPEDCPIGATLSPVICEEFADQA